MSSYLVIDRSKGLTHDISNRITIERQLREIEAQRGMVPRHEVLAAMIRKHAIRWNMLKWLTRRLLRQRSCLRHSYNKRFSVGYCGTANEA
ncbi:hypothetical protein JG687_00016559 [Phytophthora cactorum]|uniref:Uncharacterized protein n=1 Tax=Phytophthora cactorum TaxID=29920 RepID=A0A8T1TUV1_9STRA|nr:hypothetical protein GQ600_24457 [Phytophthora cactorum]KAG6946702.1 hypothetical protein JG687_00016559 [Phytophthora cactorum]